MKRSQSSCRKSVNAAEASRRQEKEKPPGLTVGKVGDLRKNWKPGGVIHGRSDSRIQLIWTSMKSRCYYPPHRSFHYYGARGITVCQRWRESLLEFIADMGECPPGMTLDRIDSTGNYEPGNCRWATRGQQGANKRNNRNLLFQGELLCVAVWARRLGCYPSTIFSRLNHGWSVEKTLTTPIKRL